MLSSRKEAILAAIVEEYTETGIPVGSIVLVHKYQFPFSTATIRAEMADLENMGYLSHPHTSAGRVPTERGYRYFVNLMEKEKALMAPENVAARKLILSMNDRYEKRVQVASKILSELTQNIAFSGIPGEIFSNGLGYLFSQPEFLDPYNVVKAAEIVDNLEYLVTELPKEFDTEIYIGSESPIGKSAGCSLVISQFRAPNGEHGYLGVVGPMRMSYPKTIAAIKGVRKVLENNNV
jgi:transcriptional regulator of heat shock response